jgi:hypothetical protein
MQHDVRLRTDFTVKTRNQPHLSTEPFADLFRSGSRQFLDDLEKSEASADQRRIGTIHYILREYPGHSPGLCSRGEKTQVV